MVNLNLSKLTKSVHPTRHFIIIIKNSMFAYIWLLIAYHPFWVVKYDFVL